VGRCGRRTKKIAKVVGRALSPVGVKLLADVTGLVASTDWTNDQKREASFELGRAALKQAGIEAKESFIRLGIETAVIALKDGQDALADLGQADDADVAEFDADD